MQAQIRQITYITFAILMFFSTTGVAFYHHICGCPIPMAQSAQISDPGNTCCNDPNTQPKSDRSSNDDHDVCDTENHDGCEDEVTYLKIPIISTQPILELTASLTSFKISVIQMFNTGLSDVIVTEQPNVRPKVMPVRAGRSLFISFHQLKIPFPEDHC